MELKEVLEIIIDRKGLGEKHRFTLNSNGVSFDTLDQMEQQLEVVETCLRLKFPDKNYTLKAYGLVEPINIIN